MCDGAGTIRLSTISSISREFLWISVYRSAVKSHKTPQIMNEIYSQCLNFPLLYMRYVPSCLWRGSEITRDYFKFSNAKIVVVWSGLRLLPNIPRQGRIIKGPTQDESRAPAHSVTLDALTKLLGQRSDDLKKDQDLRLEHCFKKQNLREEKNQILRIRSPSKWRKTLWKTVHQKPCPDSRCVPKTRTITARSLVSKRVALPRTGEQG